MTQNAHTRIIMIAATYSTKKNEKMALRNKLKVKEKLFNLELGATQAQVSYSEARCLWELLPKRKFTAIKSVTSYTSENAKTLMASLSKKFNCNELELVALASNDNFKQFFYSIEKSRRLDRQKIN